MYLHNFQIQIVYLLHIHYLYIFQQYIDFLKELGYNTDNAAQVYQSALDFLKKVKDSSAMGYLRIASELHMKLGDVSFKSKSYPKALEHFKNALALFPPTESGWKPYALTCSAVEGTGIQKVWNMVEDYIRFARENGYLEHLRTQQAKYWMYETINQNLLDSFYKSEAMEQLIAQTEQRVLNNEISSFTAAYDLLKEYGGNK